MIRSRSTGREKYRVTLVNMNTDTVKDVPPLSLLCFFQRNDTGVFVSDIVKGGLVDTDGQLMQGDQILSVNSEDVRSATQEATAALLKVRLALKRK